MKSVLFFLLLSVSIGASAETPYIYVLGVAQDAGYP